LTAVTAILTEHDPKRPSSASSHCRRGPLLCVCLKLPLRRRNELLQRSEERSAHRGCCRAHHSRLCATLRLCRHTPIRIASINCQLHTQSTWFLSIQVVGIAVGTADGANGVHNRSMAGGGAVPSRRRPPLGKTTGGWAQNGGSSAAHIRSHTAN